MQFNKCESDSNTLRFLDRDRRKLSTGKHGPLSGNDAWKSRKAEARQGRKDNWI